MSRKIDALIAEHVMGLQFMMFGEEKRFPQDPEGKWVGPPSPYSTCIKAACRSSADIS